MNERITIIGTYNAFTETKIDMMELKRYLHRIKLKKILHHISQEFTSEEAHEFQIDQDISGYIGNLKGEIGKIYVTFNTNDIQEDKIIFDFYPDELPRTFKINEEQTIALNSYIKFMNPKTYEFMTNKLVKAFGENPVVIRKEYILYRGLSWNTKKELEDFIKNCKETGYLERSEYVSSWTTNPCVVKYFSKGGYTGGIYGVIIKGKFNPKDILVDTRLIEQETFNKLIEFAGDQREVILRAQTYKCHISAIIIDKKMYTSDGKSIPYFEL